MASQMFINLAYRSYSNKHDKKFNISHELYVFLNNNEWTINDLQKDFTIKRTKEEQDDPKTRYNNLYHLVDNLGFSAYHIKRINKFFIDMNVCDIKKGWWKKTEKGFDGEVTTYTLNTDASKWKLLKAFTKNNFLDFLYDIYFQFIKEDKKGDIKFNDEKNIKYDYFSKIDNSVSPEYKLKNLRAFQYNEYPKIKKDLNFINKNNHKGIVYDRIFQTGHYLHGRFYSCFTNLPKELRNPILKQIGLIELDYSAMIFNSMYKLLHGIDYSGKDIYTDLYKKYIMLPSELKTRKYTKKLLMLLINHRSEPSLINSIKENTLKYFNYTLTDEEIKLNIIDQFYTYFPLFKIFKSKINSLWTQRLESNTVNNLMILMKKNKDLPLSIHDAIYVPKDKTLYYGKKMGIYLNKEINNWRNKYVKPLKDKSESKDIYIYYSKKVPKYIKQSPKKYNELLEKLEDNGKYEIVQHYFENKKGTVVYRTSKPKKYSKYDILNKNVDSLIKANRKYINLTFYQIKKDSIYENDSSKIPSSLDKKVFDKYSRIFIEDLILNPNILLKSLYNVNYNDDENNSNYINLNSFLNLSTSIPLSNKYLLNRNDNVVFLLSYLYSLFINKIYNIMNNKYKKELRLHKEGLYRNNLIKRLIKEKTINKNNKIISNNNIIPISLCKRVGLTNRIFKIENIPKWRLQLE